MKIVINIDENVFTRLFDNGVEDYEIANDDLSAIAKAIRGGTPLPTGYGNLIDADRVVTVSFFNEMYEEWDVEQMTIYECINQWTDEGIETKDIIIEADNEEE